jgi:hypothetical protein
MRKQVLFLVQIRPPKIVHSAVFWEVFALIWVQRWMIYFIFGLGMVGNSVLFLRESRVLKVIVLPTLVTRVALFWA